MATFVIGLRLRGLGAPEFAARSLGKAVQNYEALVNTTIWRHWRHIRFNSLQSWLKSARIPKALVAGRLALGFGRALVPLVRIWAVRFFFQGRALLAWAHVGESQGSHLRSGLWTDVPKLLQHCADVTSCMRVSSCISICVYVYD